MGARALGLKGPRNAGKSTLARALLLAADPRGDRRPRWNEELAACHLEYSDIVIDLANACLELMKTRKLEDWLDAVPNATYRVLGRYVFPSRVNGWYEDNPVRASIHRNLAAWLKRAPEARTFRITRENKLEHLEPLIWFGVLLGELVDQGVFAREMERRARKIELAHPRAQLLVVGGVRLPEDVAPVAARQGAVIELVRGSARIDRDPANAKSGTFGADTVFYNTGTLADLETNARRLMDDFRRGSLRSEYRPS